VSEYTSIFHTLCSKLGIKDSKRHLVLKYCSGQKETLTHRRRTIKESQSQENHSKQSTKKGDGKSKKDTRKWCEFHKIPWHNTDECCSKESLVVKLKEK
jgi:hypothetical protein